jgi:hypothetical protein
MERLAEVDDAVAVVVSGGAQGGREEGEEQGNEGEHGDSEGVGAIGLQGEQATAPGRT